MFDHGLCSKWSLRQFCQISTTWYLNPCIASHSSVLAWEIPWREEPGRLQSMGWQRVRYNWSKASKQPAPVEWLDPATHFCLPWFYPILLYWTAVKNLPASAGETGDVGAIPGLGRSPAGGHGNPLQFSCLENPMNRGAWRVTVKRVTKSQTWLSSRLSTEHQIERGISLNRTWKNGWNASSQIKL